MYNWAVLTLAYTHFVDSITIVITTNEPAHLTMYYTDVEPVRHNDSRTIRGLTTPWGAYFCFVGWKTIEQNEAGDTLTHTFDVPDWSYCQTFWFLFIGTLGGINSPSVSAIFEHHHPGVLTTTNRYVSRRAYYQARRSANPGDPDALYTLAHDQIEADHFYELVILYGQRIRRVGTYAQAQIRRTAMIFNTAIPAPIELISATLRLDIRKDRPPAGYSSNFDWYLHIRAGKTLNSKITHGALINYSYILSFGTRIATKYADDFPAPGYQDYWYVDIPIRHINTEGQTVITSLTSKDIASTRPANNQAEEILFISNSFTRLQLIYRQQ